MLNQSEFKIQSKLNHLVNWANVQTSSGTATTIFIEGCLQTLDTALLQESWGVFCLVLVGAFLNPSSKLTPSLCYKSVVTLDHYSNFLFTESSTGPIKVILMPASGFHKAEGTGKFQKTSASTQTCWRGHERQHEQCVDHEPLGRASTCNTLSFIHHLGKLWIKAKQLHSLLILNRIGY